jgi:hypothetical protein
MAIQQETRQVGTQPSNRLVREFRTQLPQSDMTGVARLGAEVGAIAESELKSQAVDEVNKTVEALKFGKNDDGSFSKPPAPEEWGSFKRQYFDELVNKRYTNEVLLEHDTALAKIYADTKAAGGDPTAAYAKAQADLTGRLQGVDPAIRATVEMGMRKQVQQYNTGFITSYGTRVEETETKALQSQVVTLSEQYVKANRDGNEAEAGLLKGRINSLRETLKRGGRLSANADEETGFWNSLNIESAIKKSINKSLNDPNADKAEFVKEIDKLQLIVNGTAADGDTAFGMKKSDFDKIAPNVIAGLHRELGIMSSDFRKANSVSEQMQQIQNYLKHVQNGFKFQTFGMSENTTTMAVQQDIMNENKKREGENRPPINANSPEGMAWIFNRHGFLPTKMYDSIFAKISTRSPDEIERAAVLYEAAKIGTEPGRNAPFADQIASAEDRIFLETYLNSRGTGTPSVQAIDDIKKVFETNRTIAETKDITEQILPIARRAKQNNTLTMDELKEDAAKKADLDLKNFTLESQRIFFDIFQKALFRTQGNYNGAASIAGQTFRQFYAQDPLSIAQKEQLKFSGDTFIPKGQVFPTPLDGKNQPVTNWINGYIGSIAEKYMDPARDKDGKAIEGSIKITGVGSVPISDLEAGRNIFFKSTGRATYDPSTPWHQQQGVNPSFQIWYYDPLKNNIPTLITVKGSATPLEINPHAEAKAQHDSFAEAARTGNMRINQILENEAMMQRVVGAPQLNKLRPGAGTPVPVEQPVKPIFYDTRGRAGSIGTSEIPPAVSDLGIPISGAETNQPIRGTSLYRAPEPDNLVSPSIKKFVREQETPSRPGSIRSNVDLGNTKADLVDFGKTLVTEFNTITMISGHRRPGGETLPSSQHVTGNALDFSLKGMKEEDKAKLVQRVIGDERVRGFGYYPASDSIHIDFRTGPKAAWGQNKSYTSLPNTPDWFRIPVEEWRKG